MLWFMLSLCVAGFGVANLVITITEIFIVCICVCTYKYVSTLAYSCTCVWKPGTNVECLQISSPCVLRLGLFLNLKLTS